MATIQERIGATANGKANGTSVGLVVGSCMENISAHGIPNIKRAKDQVRRLLWVCAFLLSFSVCVWQISLLINAYLNRQITTNVDVQIATMLVFPAVTVCNSNGMLKSYLEQNGGLHDSINTTANKLDDKFQEWDNTDPERHEAFFDLINLLTEHLSPVPYADREASGHTISTTLLSCTFNGYPCVPSNFSYTYNYLYGNCYTFNDGRKYPIISTTNAGPLYGLSIEMNIEQAEYVADVRPAAGLRFLIHDQGEMPFPEDQGINVSPGRETSIGIYRTEFLRLSSPYPSDCRDSSTETLFSRRFPPTIEYSKAYLFTILETTTCLVFQLFKNDHGSNSNGTETEQTAGKTDSQTLEACMKDCLYYQTFEHCGCRNSRYTFDSETPICRVGVESEEECLLDVQTWIGNGNITCGCGPACKEVSYTTSSFSSVWPGIEYMPKIVEKFKNTPGMTYHGNDTESFINNNLAKVDIYYENLQFDSVEQVATYTSLSLISNVGGHLGLWIGMSALTLLEFLECIYDISKHVCAVLFQRKRSNQTDTKPTTTRNTRVAFQKKAECLQGGYLS